MAKNAITQFIYHRMLPHGEPMNLQMGFPQDPFYLQRLQLMAEMLRDALKEVEEEIGNAKGTRAN